MKKNLLVTGIKGKEQALVFGVFDLALKGKQIDEVVFKRTADTIYSNISEYKNRQKIWAYIPASCQTKYVESTAESLVEKIVHEELMVRPLKNIGWSYHLKILHDIISK